MASGDSRIRIGLDLEAEGKRSDYLYAPISTNDSAYGLVPIPITVVRNGTGPSVLLTGGVHGDEYEGPIALSRFAREVEPSAVSGRLIILPALNLPALRAGRRLSPIDGLNLNRVFPGRREGSVTEAIAHLVTAVLFPLVEMVLDLHSGGSSLLYLPLASTHVVADRERTRRSIEAMIAFGAPIGLIGTDLDSSGLLDYTAEQHGKLVVSTELGGGGIVSPQAVAIADRGIRNVLRHFEVLRDDGADPAAQPGQTRIVETPNLDCFAMAPVDGVYEALVECGAEVATGATLGFVHRIAVNDAAPVPVTAARAGLLICRRAQGRTARGDCLAIVAEDVSAARLAELVGSG
jgi:N-alpha-acetyl-L-2,4-diaminobutyrate deacetylase